ncbi:hypothetical protein HDU96_006537 [Phlyctochytrium bullatum]|nr:hypothetical protein HDU96_006537 [Phlyctochytrium bullatum]
MHIHIVQRLQQTSNSVSNPFDSDRPHFVVAINSRTPPRQPFHSAGTSGPLHRPHRNAFAEPPVSRCWRCGAQVQVPLPTCRQTPGDDPAAPHSKIPLTNRNKSAATSDNTNAFGVGGCGAVQPVSPWTTYFDVFIDSGVKTEPNGAWSYDVDLGSIKRKFLQLQQAVHPDTHANKSELHLNDVHIDESEKLKDPELLDEVMTVWEDLEDIESDEQLERMRKENQVRVDRATKSVSDNFKKGDIEGAKNAIVELQYWVNIDKRLKEASP